MSRMPTVHVEVDIPLTPEQAGDFFARCNSEDQAKFFIAVAEQAKTWKNSAEFQWCWLGRELAETASPEAREMIRQLAHHMESYLKEPRT